MRIRPAQTEIRRVAQPRSPDRGGQGDSGARRPGASLEAVAREAGVGIGTLYRHFPTREALFEAVYRHEVEQLIELAASLETKTDGLEALRIWSHAFVGLVETKRGLLGTLALVATEDSRAMFAEVSGRLKEAVQRLLTHAMSNGELRSDDYSRRPLFHGLCGGLCAPARTGMEGAGAAPRRHIYRRNEDALSSSLPPLAT